MIKLTPYYRQKDPERILSIYLNMVADALPFRTEDVFDKELHLFDGKAKYPRDRSEGYVKLLERFSVKDGETQEQKLVADAILARRLILNYSTPLHDWLYEDVLISDRTGQINKKHLRELLTTKSPGLFRFSGPAEPAKLLLNYVFRYDRFARNNHIYDFVKRLNVSVCPYCNRMFTTTVSDGENRVRPQLDHFKNKRMYPYLALSINNLVPCCGVCNLLKRDDDKPILYPYEEGIEEKFVFRTKLGSDITPLLTGTKRSINDFDLVLDVGPTCSTDEEKVKIENTIDKLALRQLYQAHKEYVAKLYYQRYTLTETMVRDIAGQFDDLFETEEDVRHAMLLMNPIMSKWGERPLAKLTHDITLQIEEEYKNAPDKVRMIGLCDPDKQSSAVETETSN